MLKSKPVSPPSYKHTTYFYLNQATRLIKQTTLLQKLRSAKIQNTYMVKQPAQLAAHLYISEMTYKPSTLGQADLIFGL